MAKLYQLCCPKCNNKTGFNRYGKDKAGNQKYQCKKCWHQWAPDTPARQQGRPRTKGHPLCPVCGKAMYVHHDRTHYIHYTCTDKKCRHSVFVPKPTAISAPSMSKLFGKTDFKRMRYPVHVILMALTMFYLGKNSFRNIALILRTVMNVQVSHTTISNWCTHFAPMFQNIAIQLIPALNFNSDEWHADETVVKIQGVKYYLWLILDSETRFVLGFHLDTSGILYGVTHGRFHTGRKRLRHWGNAMSFSSAELSGEFTASKLAWIKENEPAVYERIYKIMLPGDYIAMKLTGDICTTVSGLSEGMFWDFQANDVAGFLMDYYGFDRSLIADIKPTFGEQGRVNAWAAKELGLKEGIPVTYRAGDQPNNALSLNVFNPGEIASTAGTSGVVYGVNGEVNYDPKSRVNTFAHVNHTAEQTRLGVLLCINGTGILNSWVKRNVAPEGISYSDMNRLAAQAPVGSAGVSILPFGNGAERMLENKETGCSICGVNFNLHGKQHIVRAAQEGIVFSFKYGIDIMEQMGIPVQKIHAGHANMFLSPIFRETLAGVTGAVIELYDTDGSVGAAKGAGIGAGVYKDNNEAFATLEKLEVIEPDVAQRTAYDDAYARWKSNLERAMAAF